MTSKEKTAESGGSKDNGGVNALYETAKSTAGQAYGAATQRAAVALNEQKGTLAEGLTTVAESVRQVGENLNSATETNAVADKAAHYSDSLARKIENVSDYFERKDVREMVRDAEFFARRNPAYFIGGAVLLGFVAARFLKSSNAAATSRGSIGFRPQMSNTNADVSSRDNDFTDENKRADRVPADSIPGPTPKSL